MYKEPTISNGMDPIIAAPIKQLTPLRTYTLQQVRAAERAEARAANKARVKKRLTGLAALLRTAPWRGSRVTHNATHALVIHPSGAVAYIRLDRP